MRSRARSATLLEAAPSPSLGGRRATRVRQRGNRFHERLEPFRPKAKSMLRDNSMEGHHDDKLA